MGRILQADLFASLLVLDSFPSTNGGLALGHFSHHDVFSCGRKEGRNQTTGLQYLSCCFLSAGPQASDLNSLTLGAICETRITRPSFSECSGVKFKHESVQDSLRP